MTEKRKPFRTLAEDLKAVRRRPVSQESVDRFNKIMDEEDKLQRRDKERSEKEDQEKGRKVARSPEADI
jgi:hypothetical protein